MRVLHIPLELSSALDADLATHCSIGHIVQQPLLWMLHFQRTVDQWNHAHRRVQCHGFLGFKQQQHILSAHHKPILPLADVSFALHLQKSLSQRPEKLVSQCIRQQFCGICKLLHRSVHSGSFLEGQNPSHHFVFAFGSHKKNSGSLCFRWNHDKHVSVLKTTMRR